MSSSTFIKSTLILTIATLFSKVLGSVFRIPLQNIAGDEVLGIFSMVYPVYMVALYLSVAGIPLAISKFIAKADAEQNQGDIRRIFLTASFLALSFGVISFAIIFTFSSGIANALGGPSTRLALVVVALTLLVAPYMAVYRGFFQGFGNMQPTAVSQVIEQLVRVILILVAAYVLVSQGFSSDKIAGGIMFGSVAGALASFIYLRLKYNRSNVRITSKVKYDFRDFSLWSKRILQVSIPIAIGSVTMALFNFVDSFTITSGLRLAGTAPEQINYLYGIYGRGQALVQIATVFATSIVLPLVPLITKKLTEKDIDGTRSVIERTHRITHLISWPAAMGLFALTLPLNLALFTNLEGSSMLAIINVSSVFTSFTLLGTGILQGMNFAKAAAFIILGGVCIKMFANILLIQLFGLNGAALSTLLVYLVMFGVNSMFIKKQIRFALHQKGVVKMILASVVMALIIGFPTLLFSVNEWTRWEALIYVFAAIIVGAFVYFIQLYLGKVIQQSDLENLPGIGKLFQRRRS